MATTTPEPQVSPGRERFTVNLTTKVMKALRHEKAETKKPYGKIIEESLQEYFAGQERLRQAQ